MTGMPTVRSKQILRKRSQSERACRERERDRKEKKREGGMEGGRDGKRGSVCDDLDRR